MIGRKMIKLVIISIAISLSCILLASCGLNAGIDFQISKITNNEHASYGDEDLGTDLIDNREGYADLDTTVIRYSYKNSQNLIANSIAKMQIIYDRLILNGETSAVIYLDLSDEDKKVYGNEITFAIARKIFTTVTCNCSIQVPHFVTSTTSVTSGYDAVYTIKNIEYWERATKTTSANEVKTQCASLNFNGYANKRSSSYDSFNVNSVDKTFFCENSDQLWYVLQMGFKPVFNAGSDVENIYNKAKAVLRQICTDDMNDLQKVEAIYEWLIYNVSYDTELCDMVEKTLSKTYSTEANQENKKYNGFYLEGVFNEGKAVCDGISKAFVVLANMEGIPCIREVGYKTDSTTIGHAWNKVYVQGKWYASDATSANLIMGSREIADYSQMLIKDSSVGYSDLTGFYTAQDFAYITANEMFDYFSTQTITYNQEEIDLSVETRAEVIELLKYFDSNVSNDRYITLQFTTSKSTEAEIDINAIKSEFSQLINEANINSVPQCVSRPDSIILFA